MSRVLQLGLICLAIYLVSGQPANAQTASDPTRSPASEPANNAPSETSSGEASPSPDQPTWEKDVLPILQAKCFRCHGEKTQKAELDLRSLESLLKGSETGVVVEPGNLEESPLFDLVSEELMPPDDEDPLSEAEIETIQRWIEAGAPAAGKSEASAVVITQHEIVPLMLLRCTACHGAGTQEAELDLRTKASMLQGGKSGPAIVPGKPEESLVLAKIHAGEMPPRDRLIEVGVKPMTDGEIQRLTSWIAAGAPEVHVEIDVATTEPDPLVTDEDRDFWSLKPPRSVAVPSVEHAERVRNPLDAFILRQLEQEGLALSPQADRLTLLRRATFDLTGLPPDPRQIERFLNDSAPDAYERLIDRLLSSPRYGERWARRWLDLAGYADSEGKRSADPLRPYAYRYRDYVIRSLNADKPYDRFLLEQIAGDELADYENAPAITQELEDNLVATGFLRMAPDGTGSDVVNFVPERLEVIADEVDIFGSVVLGLTIKCARCHSHKYDPIPHRDYYRLLDVFKGAYDEHNWLKPAFVPGQTVAKAPGRVLAYVTPEEKAQWQADNAEIDSRIAELKVALEANQKQRTEQHVEERIAALPEVLRDDLRKMLATAALERDAIQEYLATKFEKNLTLDVDELKKIDADFKKAADETDKNIKAAEAKRQVEPKIRALWDRGDPSPTYIYRRGDYLNPGRLVGPGVPSMLTDGKTPFAVTPPWPGATTTGRRLALARWLVAPDHPLTARVMVNRIWKEHFGVGIVKTLDNFGRTGTPPSHPDLLDWLAREFVRQGWSLKRLHRLMMTSSTYCQASVITPVHEARDPENRLLSRMPMRRMDAEVLRDTLLYVSASLDETRFGRPDQVDVRKDGLVTSKGTERGWRRSIYVQQRRKEIPTLLEVFDLPQMNPNCVERTNSTVASQALLLMNNRMIHELADAFADRVIAEGAVDPLSQVKSVYLLALSRPPAEDEKAVSLDLLSQLTDEWASERDAQEATHEETAARRALAAYCHTILNSAAFVYID